MRAVRGRHSLGQALMEAALALPFVLVLLAGATQVGTIAYGMVSADTAVREAGRIGQQSPHDSLDPVAASGGQYTCGAPAAETNPICIAAYQAAGLLDKTKLTVTIKLRGSSLLSGDFRPPGDVIRISSSNSPCNGAQAKVTGSVSGLPSGQEALVSSTTGGSPVSTIGGIYTLCASPGTGAVSANLLFNGCTYSAAITGVTLVKNTQYTEDFTASQSCPTTTTTTTTSTSTSTSGTTSTVTQTTTTVSGFTCSQTVTYPAFFTVTATYPVSIFVPFVNGVLADHGSGSVRTVSASVTEEIAPCGVTDNH